MDSETKINLVGGGACAFLLIVAAVTVVWLYVHCEQRGAEAEAAGRVQWVRNVADGLPPRVVVTATWQMDELAKLGYVPADGFSWSQWSGPHGCYDRKGGE
jgi:hypothetical protein